EHCGEATDGGGEAECDATGAGHLINSSWMCGSPLGAPHEMSGPSPEGLTQGRAKLRRGGGLGAWDAVLNPVDPVTPGSVRGRDRTEHVHRPDGDREDRMTRWTTSSWSPRCDGV